MLKQLLQGFSFLLLWGYNCRLKSSPVLFCVFFNFLCVKLEYYKIANKKGKELWVVEIKVTPTEKHKKEKVLTSYNREVFIRMNASTQKLDAVDLI